MNTSLNILHLEDNVNDAELIKETLLLNDLDFKITQVDNKDDFLSNLLDQKFDLILADFNLPSFDGFAALKMAKKYAKDVPFIFISGVLGEELAIETLKKGAVDYVIKSRLERLIPSIERALKEIEEKEKRILLERNIVELEQKISELDSTYQQLTKRVRGFLKIELPSFEYSIVDKFLENLSGYPIKDWQDTPNFISTIIHPDFEDYYSENISQMQKSFVPKMLEFKIIRKNGEVRWWLQFNIGAFDAEGNLTSVSAVIIDNTEDKKSQLKYQNLFENALVGMFRTNAETGEILEANAKIAELLGYSTVDEFKLQKASDFYFDKKKRAEVIEKLLEKGSYNEELIKLRKKDGSVIWLSETSRYYEEDGYIEGILIDVTDRKRAEDALRRDRVIFQFLAEAAVHSKDADMLCTEILDGLLTTLDYEMGAVGIYYPETKMIDFKAIEVEPRRVIPKPHLIDINDERSIAAFVARNKQPLIIPDFPNFENKSLGKPVVPELELGAIVTWPILDSNEELIGVLQLVSSKPKDISEGDSVLFLTISDMLASALVKQKAMDSLFESEEKFRGLAEQSLVGVLHAKNTGEVTFINESITKISEYPAEDFYSKPLKEIVSKLFTPEAYIRLEKQVESVLKARNPTTVETYSITTKSDKVKWLSIYLAPIRFENEISISAIILDVTDQYIAQQTIDRERQAYHILAEAIINTTDVAELCQSILDGLLDILDFDIGTFRLYNAETNMLYPVARKMIDEESLKEIVPLSLDNPSYLNTHVARTKEPVFAPDISKNPIAMEFIERFDRFSAKASLTYPILDGNNNLLGTIQLVANRVVNFPEADRFFFETIAKFLATALEKKWSEFALSESQETLGKLIDTSPSAVIHTDFDGIIRLVNQHATIILGYTEEDDLIGLNFFEKFSINTKQKLIDDTKQAIKDGIIQNVEYVLSKKDGTQFPFELSASVILDKDDNPESLIFIGQDITQRKQLEQNLREKYHEFEVLNKIISAGYRATDLNQFLDFVLNTVLGSLDFTGGAILLRTEIDEIKAYRSIGIPKNVMNFINTITLKSEMFKPMFTRGESMFYNNFKEMVQETHSVDINTFISVPFFSKQQIIGAIILIVKEKREITESDSLILEAIGRDVGTAISKFVAEDKIKRRQESLQSIFNTVDDAILMINVNSGRIINANISCEKIFGYSTKELTKLRLFDLHPDKDEKTFRNLLMKADDGRIQNYPMKLQTKVGDVIQFQLTTEMYEENESLILVIIAKKSL